MRKDMVTLWKTFPEIKQMHLDCCYLIEWSYMEIVV